MTRNTLPCLVAALLLIPLGCRNQSADPSVSRSEQEPTAPETSAVSTPEASTNIVKTTDAEPTPAADASEMSGEPGSGMKGGGMGRGRGMMGGGPGKMGRGMMGGGTGAMSGMQGDMSTLHAMFASRDKIKRTVKNLPDGAVSTTESDDPEIAALLQEHVPAMESRVLENKPLPPMTFHPIFVELIKHADDYSLKYEETDKGMRVTYHADDPWVVLLVQEHAALVSRFIKNGMQEIHKPYKLPQLNKSAPADADADADGKAPAADSSPE